LSRASGLAVRLAALVVGATFLLASPLRARAHGGAPAPSAPAGDDEGEPSPEGPPRNTANVGDRTSVDAPSNAAAVDPPGTPEGPRPPRVDGPYVGGVISGAGAFTRVNNLDTPAPFGGFVVDLRAGDVVFPWMSVGIQVMGGAGWVSDQRVAHGGLLMDFGFYPIKRVPFSLRAGFGFGAGAVNDEDATKRFGFGGALFKAGARYAFFPTAAKRRPQRGGGWSIGPELGWLGYTPTGPGQPMNNVLTLGLWTGFFLGS